MNTRNTLPLYGGYCFTDSPRVNAVGPNLRRCELALTYCTRMYPRWTGDERQDDRSWGDGTRMYSRHTDTLGSRTTTGSRCLAYRSCVNASRGSVTNQGEARTECPWMDSCDTFSIGCRADELRFTNGAGMDPADTRS